MSDHSEAYRNGWEAHSRGVGLDPDPNPYSEDTQPFSHSQWLDGWCSRFSALKHGGDLTLDEE